MPGPVLFIFAIWLALFFISSVRLFKSFKKKIPLQIIIYLVCFLVTGYANVVNVISMLDFQKWEKDEERQFFEHRKVGDTVTFTGWTAFRIYDTKAIQDTINKIDKENELSTGKSYFDLAVVSEDKKNWRLKTIATDLAGRDSLSKYLNYGQQKRDSVTYSFTIKAMKIYKDEVWQLLHVIRIDSAKEAPRYWH